MEYRIVETKSAEELQMKVQELIAQGWKPQGGLSVVSYGPTSWWYYQAVIR